MGDDDDIRVARSYPFARSRFSRRDRASSLSSVAGGYSSVGEQTHPSNRDRVMTLHPPSQGVSSLAFALRSRYARAMGPITDDFLTNRAYGFPSRGGKRRITPHVLAVLHITGNPHNVGPDAAQGERDYANRAGSSGPSAHYYLNRDGSGIHAIDEAQFAAWSNGDLNQPRVANHGVAYLADLKARGYNANEGCYLEIESVGAATVPLQITDAQVATLAGLIAAASQATGIIIDETTVIGHYMINTVDRPHCPSLTPDAFMSEVIAAAKEIGDTVAQAPITDETPRQITIAKGSPFYDLDAKTILTRAAIDFTWRDSPYGVGVVTNGEALLRSFYGQAGSPARRVMLVKPSGVRVPTQDCTAEITADRAKAFVAWKP